MTESQYQTKLIKKLRDRLPGCVILKNDPSWLQGVPDILVLYNQRWAALEIKLSHDSSFQPNQQYYIDLFGEMSYASFINPQNEEDVLNDLQFSFGVTRPSRVS